MKTLYQIAHIKSQTANKENYTLEAIFSTDDEDRHGDIVRQDWELKSFKKNPVILNSHNYYDALDVIGRAEKIKVVDGKLEGTIKFAVEENPKAKIIFDLYAGGFLNAFSVGFIPREWSDKGEILKSELLEVSAVSVPANAMALAKAKGIEVNKLYEQPNNDNNADKKGDGEDAETKDNDGQGNGGKSDEANKSNEGDEKNNGDGELEKKEIGGEKNNGNGEKQIMLKNKKSSLQIIAEAVEKTESQEQRVLNKIAKAVDLVSDGIKVETADKAKANKTINYAIRKLIRLKKNL